MNKEKNTVAESIRLLSLLIDLINRNLKTSIFAFLETTLKVIGDC